MLKTSASVVAGFVLLVSPFVASADTIGDLQAQISALLAQIAQLQGQTTSTSCVDLSSNLTLGSSGSDVTKLQNYLANKGYFDRGATGYYGFVTAQAVGKLQLSLGIVSSVNDSAYGIMGPRTRAAIRCGEKTEGPIFTASPAKGSTPLTVRFTSNLYSTGDAGAPQHYIDFGDGTGRERITCAKSIGDNLGSFQCLEWGIEHTYANPGIYTASLLRSTCDNLCRPASVEWQTLKTLTINATTDSSTCTTAQSNRGKNEQTFNCTCPANVATNVEVWGNGMYTDDSNICAAAVHAGVITKAGGGAVSYTIKPGRDAYHGSTENGVNTRSWGSWEGSFVFGAGMTVVPPPTVSMAGNVALNGVDQYVPLSQIGDSTAFTVSAWASHSGGSCGVIFSDSTHVSGNDVILGVDSSNVYIRADKNGAGLNSAVPMTASGVPGCHAFYSVPAGKNLSNAWHHITWVNTGSQSLVYVDGVLVRTLPVSGSNVGYHSLGAQIGRMWDGTTGSYPRGVSYFNDKISDVRYYNSALSGSQVSQLYNSGMQYLHSTITPTTHTSAPTTPNISASVITTPATIIAGTPTTLSTVITNNGTATTGGFPVIFFTMYSSPSGVGTLNSLPGQDSPALGAGASRTVTQSHTFATTGRYSVRVCVNKLGQYTSVPESTNCGPWRDVTVTAAPSTIPTITSITPTSGPIGTEIAIRGTGFTGADTVRFGSGGKRTVTTTENGTLIKYIVPSAVSACDDVPGSSVVCPPGAVPVYPSSWSVVVSNANGTSAMQTFTVTATSSTTPDTVVVEVNADEATAAQDNLSYSGSLTKIAI